MNEPLDRHGDPRALALIPARGGSKTVPRKNLQPFQDKPLIVHSIEQCLASELVDRTIVSTDDEEIAAVSRAAGADVPFLRPAEISGDLATDHECFVHALEWLAEHEDYRPGIIAHVRCTSPLRPHGLIDEGIRRLTARPEADSLRVVIPATHTPYKMWRLRGEYLEPLLMLEDVREPYNQPRQNLPTVYWQNAYLDVTRRSTVLDKRSMSGDIILGLVLDEEHDVDIDTLRDVQRAQSRFDSSGER